MANLFQDAPTRLVFIRKVIIAVLFAIVFFPIQPLMASASDTEAKVPLISLTDLEYRLGNPPEDASGVPLWAADKESYGWSPYHTGTHIPVPETVKYIWFRATLPEHDFQDAVLRFFDSGDSMDIYVDGRIIYSNHYLEQPGLRRIFEYYYSCFARLPDDSSGKTVYIRAKPKTLFNKNNTYVLDFLDLTSYENQLNDMLDSGLLNMILGFTLLAAGLMFLLLLLFIKVNAKTMLSFGVLSITSGIITLYQSYFKYIIGMPTLFYYVAFISNTIMPVAICQLFKQYVAKKYRKLADVFSLVFIIYTLVMATLDLSGLCWAFSIMPLFFAFFGLSASIMFVLMLKNHENSQAERRIIVFGAIGYCLTGLYDIIYIMIINKGEGTQYHIWGLIVLIAALVFSMVYRYNDIHRKALEYSGELEEKNKKLNEAWSEIKAAHDNIAELNRSLEQKVMERTEQLRDANSELTEMNEELTAMNEQLMATMDALTETQAQLIQTEKIAALGKLVAGVAHELNTPVAAISSNIQFEEALLDQVDLDDTSSMREYFSSIAPLREINREAGGRIANIVRNLTNFSGLDESDLKEVDLVEGLDSTVIVLGKQLDSKNIAIKKEYSYIPKITCYPKLMNQVFMDLLENAIEAVHTGGTITIGTSCSGSRIHISFRNDGEGISPEDLQKVFDPRFTTKGGRVGIGLGLPLSYRIVEKHGGNIVVNSAPGEGTEFVIVLPCDRQTQ